jgi:hypothetical protein
MEILWTKDTGTLHYDTYVNDDQSECMVLERFRDSEAVIEHSANLGDLTDAILPTVSVVHGELLGEPNAELRAKLAGSEVPVIFTPYCRCRHQDLAVWDDDHLFFADISSPRPWHIHRGSLVEVNVVHPFVREGCRFKRPAVIHEPGTEGFSEGIKRLREDGSVRQQRLGVSTCG